MRFLLVALALLALGCRQAASPVEEAAAPITEVSVQSGELVMTMGVSSAEVSVGEAVAVSFVLRNTAEADRVLHSISTLLFDFAVYAADGRTVMRKAFSTTPLLPQSAVRVLRGGEATAASVVWTPKDPGHYQLEGYAVWTAPGTPLLTTPRLAVQVRRP